MAVARRWASDEVRQTQFALHHGDPVTHPCGWATYELPLFDYPGQESMGRAKRQNLALVAALVHGLQVRPGQTFSFWRVVGRPTAPRGFLPATALKDGRLTAEVGGAVCFISTVLYNAALLAGMTVTERHAHSLDTYGSARYFELGRDAAVEFGYLDLRFRNDHAHSVVLLLHAEPARVVAAVSAPVPREFNVEIIVSEPDVSPATTFFREVPGLAADEERVLHPGYDGVRTTTRRVMAWQDGSRRVDDLGESVHSVAPRLIERGRSTDSAPVR